MRTRTTYRIGLVLAVGVALAGCGGQAGSAGPGAIPSDIAPSSAAPSSAAPSVSAPAIPDEPPREPGDTAPSTGWVTGLVTIGGSGPCYGLIADDGKRYALYSTAGVELRQGARFRVLLEPTMLRIYCGPGSLMAMTDAEQIR